MKTNHGGVVSKISSGLVMTGFAVVVLAGCSSPGNISKQQANLPREQVDARGLYAENCAHCHAENGSAKTFRGRLMHAKDFTSPDFKTASNDDVVRVITMGHDKMPEFGDKLSPAEIEALAGYVKMFSAAQ